MSQCTVCGFVNPEGMRFCGNCGTPLRGTARSEERKLVTVLFVDVVGSTKIATAVDPERLHGQMRRFFAIAQEEIDRFGGTIEKFIGDAVMAVFGLPAVHEDDAERAARAALAVRHRVAPEADAGRLAHIRIGVNTGEVVANPAGLEKGEFLMTGEAINLAARLQQHAAPGQILLGARTAGLLRSTAALRAVPPLQVKGVDDPLPAWELLDMGAPQERELRSTPFVGREEDLLLLDSHLRRMRRESRGHVVTILGPAGVGKTRLVREFRMRADRVHVLRGRALPYGTGVSFWSVGEAIRDECGILFGDTLDVAREKLRAAAERLEVSDAVPALRSVLGLGEGDKDLPRQELFAGMRALFEALARTKPLVLILEDMHLAEDVTLDFLEQAAVWNRDTPFLLLILARPELLERREQWMGGKRSATTTVLEPLNGEESRALVAGILGGKPMPEAVLDQLLQRADGNPLFLEEMLRALIERGVLADRGEWVLTVPAADLTIPDTVHAVIAARVDALAPAEKQVLQAAAVQGKVLWLGGIRETIPVDSIDDAVNGLVAKELLIHRLRSTVRGEEEFMFRHILIRDVAYATIPKALRGEMHRQVAVWMDAIAGEREAEFADFVAHHWLQVVALRRELALPPDEEARAQAVAHLLTAARRAAGVYANTTALDHYTKTLDLVPEGALRLEALEGRGRVWMLLGQFDRARDDFMSLRDLSRERGEGRWEAVALDHLGHSFRRQDRTAEARQALEPALALSRTLNDARLTARILNHIGFTNFSDGRHTDAMRAHEEARALLAGLEDPEALTESAHGMGENLFFQGRFQECLPFLAESMQISLRAGNRALAAENQFMIAYANHELGAYGVAQLHAEASVAALTEIGDARNLSVALWNAATLDTTMGEIGRALDHAGRGLQISRDVGSIRFIVYNLGALAAARREVEDYHGAHQLGREAAALAQRVGGSWRPWILAGLALDSAALGQADEARGYLAEAHEEMARTEARASFVQELTHAEGRVALAHGDASGARAAGERLLDILAGSGTLHWQAIAYLLLADAAWQAGDEEAGDLYRAAEREAVRNGRQPTLWRSLAGWAEVASHVGDTEGARAAALRAKDVVERIAAGVADERLRATFLQSARVQRLNVLANL